MMSVEQLVQNAARAGAAAITMTDINNSTGIPEFAGECKKQGIRPVAGIEFRNGNAVAVDGEKMTPAQLLAHLNYIGGQHGIEAPCQALVERGARRRYERQAQPATAGCACGARTLLSRNIGLHPLPSADKETK